MGKKRIGPEEQPGPETQPSAARPDSDFDAQRILRAPARPPPARPKSPFKTRDSKRKR